MPVSKLSDAPANIRELDEATLTLAQVNWILRVYDRLKEEGKVDEPMAVAIAQFKESYRKEGDGWVKQDKEAAAMTASIDLDNLERYIVVEVGALAVVDVEDLRELSGDFPTGVHALWSDEHQTIVAFAFEPSHFEQAQAEDWVKDHLAATIDRELSRQPHPLRALLLNTAMSALRFVLPDRAGDDQESVSMRSFDDTRMLINAALSERFGVLNDGGHVIDSPWIVDLGPSQVVFMWNGKQYAAPYTIGLNDAVALGEMTPVLQEWVQRVDGSPIMLHALSIHLDDGAIEEADGLIWKEIMRPGKWYQQGNGAEAVEIEITADMVQNVFDAFTEGLPQYVSVPADSHYLHRFGIVPPDKNVGFVRKLSLQDGARLSGGFEFTEPKIEQAVRQGGIADCSVYLRANVVHPTSGTVHPWILRHVLLTNNPLLQGLEGFDVPAAIVAEAGPDRAIVVHYKQEDIMTEGQDNGRAKDLALLEQYQGLGTVEDLQALAERQADLAAQARQLRVSRIVRALEGLEKLDGVQQVDGCRHYPAVVAAVEQVLTGAGDLALAADAGGATALDAAVLQIVNALPAEARLAVAADAGPRSPRDPLQTDVTLDRARGLGPDTVPDTAIEALDDQIGGRHTATVGSD